MACESTYTHHGVELRCEDDDHAHVAFGDELAHMHRATVTGDGEPHRIGWSDRTEE